jgi:hypothetical protein
VQLPTARIYVPLQQSVVAVHPGNFIGRLATATIHIPDPRVSEAHALVSLRGNRLKLLALRGKLLVDDEPTDSALLVQGSRIALTDGILLFVEDVYVPRFTLMLCGAEQGPVELVAATYSLVPGSGPGPGPGLRLVPEYVDGASAHLWFSADALWISCARAEPEVIAVGRPYIIEGVTLQVISLPRSGTSDTMAGAGVARDSDAEASLVVTARYTSVHIHCGGDTVVIGGRPANILSELVRFGGKPVPWEVAAREVWGAAPERMLLRQNLDRTLQRLRERLRAAKVREDLVTLDGTGNIELVLHPTDRIVDET